jgi:hypothetical protein
MTHCFLRRNYTFDEFMVWQLRPGLGQDFATPIVCCCADWTFRAYPCNEFNTERRKAGFIFGKICQGNAKRSFAVYSPDIYSSDAPAFLSTTPE